MLRLIFSCILIITFSYASIDERKVDIYFTNDAWVSTKDATNTLLDLQDEILEYIYNFDEAEMKKWHNFKFLENWNQNAVVDFLELWYQLKSQNSINSETSTLFQQLTLFAQTVSVLRKSNIISFLVTEFLKGVAEEAVEEAVDAFNAQSQSWITGNVNQMYDKAYKESFSKSHKMLLISHGQGGFFANDFSKVIVSGYKTYFRNLAVGSSSKEVLNGLHVTIPSDDSYTTAKLGSNTDSNPNQANRGHDFVKAYLRGTNSKAKIIKFVTQLRDNLKKEKSQWGTASRFENMTCNYNIETNHLFDTSIENVKNVIPYNENSNGLLYQIPEENGTKILYVKGHIDGESVRYIPDQNRTLCEKVSQEQICSELTKTTQTIKAQFTPPTYEILEDLNPKECSRRLTLKNTETNQTIKDVYPFATNITDTFVYDVLDENNNSAIVFTNACDATGVKTKNEFIYDCYELENTNEEITKEVIIDDIKAFDIVKNGSINDQKHQQYIYSSSAASNPNGLDAHFSYNNWCLADNSEEKIKAKLRDYTGNYIGAPGRLSSPLVDEFTNLFTFISNEGRYYYVNGSIPTSTSSSSPRRDLSFTSEDINTFLPQGDFKLKEENLLWTNRDSVHDVDQNKYMGHTDLFCSENKKALVIDFDYQTLFYYRDVANSSLIFQHEATPKY